MIRSKAGRTMNIDEVRARFEQWRQNRQGRARVPDELWAGAIEVARRDGVNRTAAALHLVWRLDRWGRSVADLLATLQELDHLGVGFVSLTEALDLTTPAGRAMAALLAVFAGFEREVLRERVRAGLAMPDGTATSWAGP